MLSNRSATGIQLSSSFRLILCSMSVKNGEKIAIRVDQWKIIKKYIIIERKNVLPVNILIAVQLVNHQ